jgi:beta-glucoside kinase
MTLSIDLGGSKIRIAQVSGTKIKNKKIISTPSTKSKILSSLFQLIDSYKKPSSINIALAGFIKNQKLYGTPNLSLDKTDLKFILQKKYRCPIKIENDANCAGLAELRYGRGKSKSNFVLLTLGTGIGGAIIINKRLYKGTGFAGEPGHMIINNKQLEKIASGSYHESKLSSTNHKSLDKKIAEALSLAILNISYILDPELIILGGGFSSHPGLIQKIKSFFHSKDILKRKIPIVKVKFGDDAGLIGAGLL